MVRSWLHSLVRFLFKNLSQLCVTGLNNVPNVGPALLAVNHLSQLDSPVIFSIVERDDLTGLVADKYQRTPLISWIVKAVNGIWINRESADFRALRSAVDFLQQGGMLGVAPEGTRSKTGALIQAKTGIAYLADKADVQVIPVAIWGSETAIRQLLRFRRPVIHVHFGESFRLPRLDKSIRSLGLQNNSDEIMCHIAALLPVAYRGVYSEHPRLREIASSSH